MNVDGGDGEGPVDIRQRGEGGQLWDEVAGRGRPP